MVAVENVVMESTPLLQVLAKGRLHSLKLYQDATHETFTYSG